MISIEIHVRRASSASVAVGLIRSDLSTFDDRARERQRFFIDKYHAIREKLQEFRGRTSGQVECNLHTLRVTINGVQWELVQEFVGFIKTVISRVDVVQLETQTTRRRVLDDWMIDAEMRRDEGLLGRKFSSVSEWASGCVAASQKYPTISMDMGAFHQHLRELGITPPPVPTRA